ncbi:hypothetical protein TWF730_007517 [Orbilia blumenaviensis]|uniref:Uncharacterized protein n=1 Tax=Orbilia blumenaviensis TaxID=1796055 RepID=A0AAV9V8L2_9PEZI
MIAQLDQEPILNMCWLSVQCACKHNIAIVHPSKACIRPRHPRGCWVIRRGDPIKSSCPGCDEYITPGSEQPSWKDVKRCHDDPVVEWSELNHSDIISMDRTRHKTCEDDRLDLRRRIRWKVLIAHGKIEGWALSDRGVIFSCAVSSSGNDDDTKQEYHDDEIMEVIDHSEIQKMLLDPMESEEDDDNLIGYKLQRVPATTQLGDISGASSDEDIEMFFQLSKNSDSSSSGSEDSSEAVLGSDDLVLEDTTMFCGPDGGEKNESLVRLDEMFDQVEATPVVPQSLTGDPVKKPLPLYTPMKLELKKEPDTAVSPVTAASEFAPSIPAPAPISTSMPGDPILAQRDKIDQALRRMRRMKAAYFSGPSVSDPPERPLTPIPMRAIEGDPNGRPGGEDLKKDDMFMDVD